jgi:hypothetical protein
MPVGPHKEPPQEQDDRVSVWRECRWKHKILGTGPESRYLT